MHDSRCKNVPASKEGAHPSHTPCARKRAIVAYALPNQPPPPHVEDGSTPLDLEKNPTRKKYPLNDYRFFLLATPESWKSQNKPPGALPYVGEVPLDPPSPFLRQSYTQWPPFDFDIKFYIQIANFRVHFEKFNNFAAILTKDLQILAQFDFFTLNDHHFWESTPKKTPGKRPHIFGVHTEGLPAFSTPHTPMPPI